MPYISTQEVKEIREKLKKELPECKFSVTRSNHSGVSIDLLEGPFEFEKGYEQLNHYYYQDHYKDMPEFVAMLDKVMGLIRGTKKISYTGDEYSDYGSVPSYYTWLSVGKWNKPYKKVERKASKKAA